MDLWYHLLMKILWKKTMEIFDFEEYDFQNTTWLLI